jgi:alpha-ribazole phosphatase
VVAAVILTLLRHTRVALDEGICYGASDVPLADDVDEHFARIATVLPRDWQQIVSSPLQRCRRLAEHLAGDRPLRYDERLSEISFGAWELRPWSDLQPAEYWAWGADWVKVAPPDGESLEQLAARLRPALAEILASDIDTLIVSHGGPLRVILGDCLGLTLREGMCLPIDRGHWCRLEQTNGTWSLLDDNLGG